MGITSETTQKRKICLVSQRYGERVNGGAELLARQYAERLSAYFDVDVLTSCAVDYYSWKNEYAPGRETKNGVTVLRFETQEERDMDLFGNVSHQVYTDRYNDMEQCARWYKVSGPYCPTLRRYIMDHKDDYIVFIFMGYLYYTTTICMPCVARKAIMITTAHDEEPFNRVNFYRALFRLPAAFVFLSEEEKNLVQSRFHNGHIPYVITGAGVTLPEGLQKDKDRFKARYGMRSDYIIYVGRVDAAKGCAELFEYFKAYKNKHPDDLKLVLAGGRFMDVPQSGDIIELGFLSEVEKFAAIAGAKALVQPSGLESLGIVVLEAMKLGVPVLLNANSDVLRGQAKRSNAGLSYSGKEEFLRALHLILTDEALAKKMGENGIQFVDTQYGWDIIEQKLCRIIDKVSGDELEG